MSLFLPKSDSNRTKQSYQTGFDARSMQDLILALSQFVTYVSTKISTEVPYKL
jgi:hypothetical protein